MKRWRLLDSGPSRGSRNLALDEAIFRLARQGASPPTVRFYAWSPPAVSVGYFQRWSEQIDPEICRKRGIDVFRRITGGRAVLHRDEITYSVVCAESRALFGAGLQAAYRTIALALAEGLRLLGVQTRLAPPVPAKSVRGAARNPSCFAASSGHEIDAPGGKLVGSAQKREGADLLQHGSILIASHGEEFRSLLRNGGASTSRELGMTSLEKLMGRRPSHPELVSALAEGFRRILGVPLEPGGLMEEERDLAGELERSRYLVPAWNDSGKDEVPEANTADFLCR
jgi:lipoate-protein ligase A